MDSGTWYVSFINAETKIAYLLQDVKKHRQSIKLPVDDLREIFDQLRKGFRIHWGRTDIDYSDAGDGGVQIRTEYFSVTLTADDINALEDTYDTEMNNYEEGYLLKRQNHHVPPELIEHWDEDELYCHSSHDSELVKSEVAALVNGWRDWYRADRKEESA